MESKNKKLFIIAGITVLLIVGVLAWLSYSPEAKTGSLNYTYASENYGLSFVYPENYEIKESYISDPQAPRNAITLSDQSGGELIKIEIFSNSLSQTPLKAWIMQSPASLYGQSDGQLIEASIDGTPAYSYTLTGESQGKVTVFEHNGYIVSISGEYEDGSEARRDYNRLISNISLQ
jgi:hypothetical protein